MGIVKKTVIISLVTLAFGSSSTQTAPLNSTSAGLERARLYSLETDYGLPLGLLTAICQVESRCNRWQKPVQEGRRKDKAYGPFQLRRIAVRDVYQSISQPLSTGTVKTTSSAGGIMIWLRTLTQWIGEVLGPVIAPAIWSNTLKITSSIQPQSQPLALLTVVSVDGRVRRVSLKRYPVSEAEIAATYLLLLRMRCGSWVKTISAYNTGKCLRTTSYKDKVLRYLPKETRESLLRSSKHDPQ